MISILPWNVAVNLIAASTSKGGSKPAGFSQSWNLPDRERLSPSRVGSIRPSEVER
jgi:hypothetical protein